MEMRHLGTRGLTVSALGLGCMGMSFAYGSGDEAESIATIHRALERGVTFFDTAEIYGPYTNELLLGKALRGKRDRAVVATKFGFRISEDPSHAITGTDGSPANVRRVAEASLERLGIDVIDLYYQHRRDPHVPIEETVGAMAELVAEGKVRYLGLSEVGVATLRRANAVHPISALQSEYSLWERGIEPEILPVLRELGIGLVPYSPLGRGFLTGRIAKSANLAENDFRRTDPRFSDEHARENAALVAIVERIAAVHGATPAQIALAWVLGQGEDVVPIPGTKRVSFLDDNLGAVEIALTAEDRVALDGLADRTAGERYSAAMMSLVER